MASLDGILVADFSRVLAGPYATMLLGDLGADVIKVERPQTGDDTRAWGPPWREGESTYYLGLNRNKRSVVLDLTDEGDRELGRRLADRADVMVESFRPGLMEQWGLDGDALRERNPRLVSCSVTAFGSGEGRSLPGYDFLLQAMGGLMHVTGEPDGEPLKVGAPIVDLTCGLLATIGIQAALAERERTGRGSHVELSLMDAALTALVNQASAWVAGGVAPRRRGNRHPSITPYETFETADRPIAVAVANERLFQRLCAVLGLEDLPADERFSNSAARIQHADELAETLGAVLRTEGADHWIERMRAASVPAGPINGVDDAFAFAAQLGMEPTQDYMVRPPMRFDGERPPIRRPPPALDEQGDEIRAWLRG